MFGLKWRVPQFTSQRKLVWVKMEHNTVCKTNVPVAAISWLMDQNMKIEILIPSESANFHLHENEISDPWVNFLTSYCPCKNWCQKMPKIFAKIENEILMPIDREIFSVHYTEISRL